MGTSHFVMSSQIIHKKFAGGKDGPVQCHAFNVVPGNKCYLQGNQSCMGNKQGLGKETGLPLILKNLDFLV